MKHAPSDPVLRCCWCAGEIADGQGERLKDGRAICSQDVCRRWAQGKGLRTDSRAR